MVVFSVLTFSSQSFVVCVAPPPATPLSLGCSVSVTGSVPPAL